MGLSDVEMKRVDLEPYRRFLVALLSGIVGEILGLQLTGDWPTATLFAINTAVLGFVLEWVLIRAPQDQRRLGDLEDKVKKIPEHVALFTENGTFERVLGKLRNPEWGKVTWVVADYISKKLEKHFPDDDNLELLGVGPVVYSEWVSQWLSNCEQSAWFIIPFTPVRWFDALLNSHRDVFERIKRGTQVGLQYIPKHVLALRNCPARDKKRIVIVTSEEWETMFSHDNIPYLKEFMRINNQNADLYFIISCMARRQLSIDIIMEDYIILDGHVLLNWKPGEQRLELVLHRDTVNARVECYRRLIESSGNFRYDSRQMSELIGGPSRRRAIRNV